MNQYVMGEPDDVNDKSSDGCVGARGGLGMQGPFVPQQSALALVANRDGLHLYLDPSRLVQTDPDERQALISCGAVLDHLRVAMAAAGWRAHIDRFPDTENSEHLASIGFTEMPAVTDESRRRAEAIVTRRTDRLAFGPVTDWVGFETVLRSRLEGMVALVDVVSDADRHRLVQATDLTNALRFYDTEYFRALQRWTAPFEASEGIPYDSLVSAAEGTVSTWGVRSR